MVSSVSYKGGTSSNSTSATSGENGGTTFRVQVEANKQKWETHEIRFVYKLLFLVICLLVYFIDKMIHYPLEVISFGYFTLSTLAFAMELGFSHASLYSTVLIICTYYVSSTLPPNLILIISTLTLYVPIIIRIFGANVFGILVTLLVSALSQFSMKETMENSIPFTRGLMSYCASMPLLSSFHIFSSFPLFLFFCFFVFCLFLFLFFLFCFVLFCLFWLLKYLFYTLHV